MAQVGPNDPPHNRRYIVKVKDELRRVIPITAFDPTPSLVFETRERAEGWCEALNKILGYSRFMVAEVETKPSAGASEQSSESSENNSPEDETKMLPSTERWPVALVSLASYVYLPVQL
jgi:hypothetical protein